MSAEATGWTWKHSPFRGAELLVHLAIADVVNDAHDNRFWMSTGALAAKAKVSRSTVTTTLSTLVKVSLLEVVRAGYETRKPSEYRFLMPVDNTESTSAVVAHDPETRALTDSSSAISAPQHARSARAIPKEQKEPKPKFSTGVELSDSRCARCGGDGEFYDGRQVFRDGKPQPFKRPCPDCSEAVNA